MVRRQFKKLQNKIYHNLGWCNIEKKDESHSYVFCHHQQSGFFCVASDWLKRIYLRGQCQRMFAICQKICWYVVGSYLGGIHIWRQMVRGNGGRFSQFWFHKLRSTNKTSDEGSQKRAKIIWRHIWIAPNTYLHTRAGALLEWCRGTSKPIEILHPSWEWLKEPLSFSSKVALKLCHLQV